MAPLSAIFLHSISDDRLHPVDQLQCVM